MLVTQILPKNRTIDVQKTFAELFQITEPGEDVRVPVRRCDGGQHRGGAHQAQHGRGRQPEALPKVGLLDNLILERSCQYKLQSHLLQTCRMENEPPTPV